MKKRKFNRKPNHNYNQPGRYFVTICTLNRKHHFGEINNDSMKISKAGKIVREYWLLIPKIRPEVTLGDFVIMPNHIHGVINLENYEYYQDEFAEIYLNRQSALLSKIIGYFKASVTKQCKNFGYPISWQRSYYDVIIKNDRQHNAISNYIRNNVLNWDRDIEKLSKDSMRKARLDEDRYYSMIYGME
jgi:REP element-mobilizing transposase RayT